IEAAGHIRYPDGFVVCSPVANASTVVRDPVVIFEVLSPGTSSTDRIVKNQEYQATLSIQRYITLEQDRIAVTVFTRAGGEWSGRVVLDDAILSMPEIGIGVPLAEFYEGIALGIPGDVKETGHTD
ncbi:MAG TPA: Uma2 family endonuclease, partial [Methylocella sp.]|nr:Uma2 family endonuclease [Methylocella sp.]